LRDVVKIRHSFTYANRHLELDEFLAPVKGFFKLEIEVSDLSESVELPPGWEATNVTADNRYSNYSIAAGLLPAEAYA
jgi:CYTH domain-containing protein